ncbi:hypothetical protein CBR_g45311 [Chara braunii]|uniref:Uncharacterized protein n=1 Tax=Chara braunii TaxID=69332 RepID=A0A388LYE0_CHABU|nr:hypothetical protein CBR_g45311 [Chara braunii]|eukprot:GBG87252.1 hypothetical protein CBR_g45311 [Chara braunii]
MSVAVSSAGAFLLTSCHNEDSTLLPVAAAAVRRRHVAAAATQRFRRRRWQRDARIPRLLFCDCCRSPSSSFSSPEGRGDGLHAGVPSARDEPRAGSDGYGYGGVAGASRRSRLNHSAAVQVRASSSSSSSPSPSSSSSSPSAREAVERGLSLYGKSRISDALACFEEALSMRPSAEVAQAALYNKACCHALRDENEAAAEALRTVLSKYNLSFGTILSDPDLETFRATAIFAELQNQALAGDRSAGQGFRKDLRMIAEVQAPFRGVRLFFYLSLTAAATISTFFTIPRLIAALKGVPGGAGLGAPPPPEVVPTLQNLAINLGGIALFAVLYQWDKRGEEQQIRRIARDETLSRLRVRLSTGKSLTLEQLRGTSRPVIIAGKAEAVAQAVKRAGRYRTELLERGILLIPLVFGSGNDILDQRRKKGFGSAVAAAAAGPSPPTTAVGPPGNATMTDEFAERAKTLAGKAVEEAERKFKAEPVSQQGWEQWMLQQQEVTGGVQPGEEVYVILRLDGRIRRSGKGTPDWEQLVNELPPVKAFVSQLEK